MQSLIPLFNFLKNMIHHHFVFEIQYISFEHQSYFRDATATSRTTAFKTPET